MKDALTHDWTTYLDLVQVRDQLDVNIDVKVLDTFKHACMEYTVFVAKSYKC